MYMTNKETKLMFEPNEKLVNTKYIHIFMKNNHSNKYPNMSDISLYTSQTH